MKKDNVNFKVGQEVECTVGLNKGRVFKIEKILDDSYSCTMIGASHSRYYEYTDSTLKIA